MISRRLRGWVPLFLLGAVSLPALLTTPSVASALTPQPVWSITSTAAPSQFAAGYGGLHAEYMVVATNSGGAASDGTPVTISDDLPSSVSLRPGTPGDPNPLRLSSDVTPGATAGSCDPGPPVSCELPPIGVPPGASLFMYVPVDIDAAAAEIVTNHVTVTGGGAPAATSSEQTPIGPGPSDFGVQSDDFALTDAAGREVVQAGSHPYRFHFGFQLRTNVTADDSINAPAGTVKDVTTRLPVGLVVDSQATALRCTEAQLEQLNNGLPSCPDESTVGVVHVVLQGGGFAQTTGALPVYNMLPPPGSAASLAFNIPSLNIAVHLLGRADPENGYALTADVRNIPQFGFLSGVSLDLWGNPSDPSHDQIRGQCAVLRGSCPVTQTDVPFISMPSACSATLASTLTVSSWEDPASSLSQAVDRRDSAGDPLGVNGCSTLDFDPTLTAQPTTQAADSPTGLAVDLHVPQMESMDTLATANLKRTVVDLPAGMAVNPAAAPGLGSCTPAQIGLTTPIGTTPAHFTADPDTCPDSAKVGTVEITTPLLPDPLQGQVYLAQQDANPFPNPSLLALYITVKDPDTGVVLKLPGKVTPDPRTGQLHASFDDTPELPFSDFELHFKSGDRSTLVTPPSCGNYQTSSQFSPWSTADPDNPTPGEIKTSTDSFQITTGPGGGPCPDYLDPSRFTPGFSAGTLTPIAGSSSPFVLKITRPDGQQQIKQIHLDLPPGLLANLNGVPKCSQSQIQTGVGGHANCPAGSQIGTVNAGAGAGNTPFFLTNQPVYLTEGYNGAPYGIAIDTDLLAGPFDLGHLVVRSTLNVDPDDAQVHIDSEQLPSIIDGIPLHIRSIAVDVNRPGFMLNPTNCNPMTVTGTVTGGGADFADPADDTTKPVSDRFQVGGCGALGFSPHLSGSILNGAQGIHRSDHPNLSFNLHGTPGDSNLAAVTVLLPQSLQIDQAELGNICSETQLATNECAGRNAVGTASATTPILGSTLSGPVYAVSGSGGLPKLAVILHGPPADPVKLLVRGITSTVGARIQNTFPLVPDAPVTDFTLTLNGGPSGYLVNNTDVCGQAKGHSKKARKKANRLRRTNLTADASFTAQDGDTLSQAVRIAAQCPKAKQSKARARRHHRHR